MVWSIRSSIVPTMYSIIVSESTLIPITNAEQVIHMYVDVFVYKFRNEARQTIQVMRDPVRGILID